VNDGSVSKKLFIPLCLKNCIASERLSGTEHRSIDDAIDCTTGSSILVSPVIVGLGTAASLILALRFVPDAWRGPLLYSGLGFAGLSVLGGALYCYLQSATKRGTRYEEIYVSENAPEYRSE